jgi:hypothetical protein
MATNTFVGVPQSDSARKSLPNLVDSARVRAHFARRYALRLSRPDSHEHRYPKTLSAISRPAPPKPSERMSAAHLIGRFIDEVYNGPRLHAALSYLSPQQFEHRTGRRSNQRPDRCPGRGADSSIEVYVIQPSSLRWIGGRVGQRPTYIIDVEMLGASLESVRWFRSPPRPMRKRGVRIGNRST